MRFVLDTGVLGQICHPRKHQEVRSWFAGRDGAEQIWNAKSGRLRMQFNHHHGRIYAAEFDATSKVVLAAGANGSVVVVDVTQGMPVAILEGPRDVIRAAHFDPVSRRIVGASWDGTARVWNATSPYRQWSSAPVRDDCGLFGGLEPERRVVAVGCRDEATRVWDTAHDQLIAELPSVTPVNGEARASWLMRHSIRMAQ